MALRRLHMCRTTNECHLVSSPGEHGAVKATYSACTNNGNMVKSRYVQNVPWFAEKLKLIFIYEVHAIEWSGLVADCPGSSLPTQIQFFVVCSTITQIKIDQTLIRNSNLLRNAFEVADRVFIQSNGDLFF